jgi:predicted metal-dependent phosphoesterase TrpH
VHRILLHNHSTWSDGTLSLTQITRLGTLLGASAVAMSEHDFDFTPLKWDDYKEACRAESRKECILIPGIEYSSPDDNIHIVTVGTTRYFGARRDLLDTLSAVHAEGGACILAHPRRHDSFKLVTPELVKRIDAIEIWNRKADGLLPVRSYYRFAKTNALTATVGIDLHTRRQIFPMWNIMEAHTGPLDGVALATALRHHTIRPAWLMGNLDTGLDNEFSIGVATLAVAEFLRHGLLNLRDAINK